MDYQPYAPQPQPDRPYGPYQPYDLRPYTPPSVPEEPQRKEMRAVRVSANRLCWMLLCVIVAVSAVQLAAFSFLGSLGYSIDGLTQDFWGLPPILYYLLSGAITIVGFCGAAFLYLAATRTHVDDCLSFSHTRPSTFLAVVLFGAGICFLSQYAAVFAQWLQDFAGINPALPSMPISDDPLVQVFYFISIAVMPSLVEEFVFRGVLLGSLRKNGDAFAIVISAIVFALFHGNITQMVFAFPCGLALGFAVARTGNLWAGVAIHFINNSYAVITELVMRGGTSTQTDAALNVLPWVVIVLGVLAFVFIVLRRKELLCVRRPSSTAVSLTRWRKLGAFFSCPGSVVFVAYCFGTAILLAANVLTY